MKKQIIISAIGLILVLGMVANAGEEDIRRMREIEQMRIKVEQLRLEAMEHELQARQLRTEAARLNLHIRTEMNRRQANLERAEAEKKLHQMFKEAEQLKKQGHIDEAHKLHAHAVKMYAQMRQGQQRGLEGMERTIAVLREASQRAEKDGQIDKAKRLWGESENLAEELERRTEGRQREEHMHTIHTRMRKLAQALERAEREGNERLADILREEMGNLEKQLHQNERCTEAEHIKQEIHQLLAEAEKAEEKGRGDKADAMRHEAEQLKRHLHELCEECSNEECDKKCEDDENDERDDSNELWEKIESLHRQLAELNEAVEHLRNELK